MSHVPNLCRVQINFLCVLLGFSVPHFDLYTVQKVLTVTLL